MKEFKGFQPNKITEGIGHSFGLFDEYKDPLEDYTLTSEEAHQTEIEDAYELNLRTLGHQVEESIRLLEDFNLNSKDTRKIRDFLTFMFQTQNLRLLYKEKEAYFNLLISTEDDIHATNFAKKLGDICNLSNIAELNEEYYIDRVNTYKNLLGEANNKDMLIITGCKYIPAEKTPLSSYQQKSARETKNVIYKEFWMNVKRFISEHKNIPVIVIASPQVVRNVFKNDSVFYNELFSHHINVNTMTAEQVFSKCISKLERNGYELTREFNESLKNYINQTYPNKDFSCYDFIDNVINKITVNVFKASCSNMILTDKCIPQITNKKRTPEEVLSELDGLVGLTNVKRELNRIYSKHCYMPESSNKTLRHMQFLGNPGTGKTTVGKKMAEIFHSMGILPSDKFVLASAKDIIERYVGSDVDNMNALINDADGGVLFIDEAYSLFDEHNSRQELAAVLIDAATERADSLIIILAGYEKEMANSLRTNPGFEDRFPKKIIFEDYTCDELVQIFINLCKADNFSIDEDAIPVLRDVILAHKAQESFANARTVGNIYQKVLEHKFDSLTATNFTDFERRFTEDDLLRLRVCDSNASLDDLVGLESLKREVNNLINETTFKRSLRDNGFKAFDDSYMNMILLGNPGTGKTTVAKKLGNILYSAGVLKNNKTLVLERKDLVADFVGGTEKRVEQTLGPAYGGMIFIDEAYTLNRDNNDYGRIVIDQLVKAMEDHREDTVFILAGYPEQMCEFLDANPGLSSRFRYRFTLEDYTTEELTKMFSNKLSAAGLKVSPKALKKAEDVIAYFRPMKHFGNGRFVDNLISQTITLRSKRGIEQSLNDIKPIDIPDIKAMSSIMSGSDSMYDPNILTDDMKYRTAVHEAGHFILALANNFPVESISIRSEIGSLGRVTLKEPLRDMTKSKCIQYLAMLLGGRNAERLILKENGAGCSEDCSRAKALAKDMDEVYCMGEFGTDSKDEFLKEADSMATDILIRYQDILIRIAKDLIDGRTVSPQNIVLPPVTFAVT